MKTKVVRCCTLLMVVIMLMSTVMGCAGSPTPPASTTEVPAQTEAIATETEAAKQPMLEYSFAFYDASGSKWVDNPNDVVTPFVEQKFNIRVKNVILPTTQSFKERLNQWIAARDLPDVIVTGKDEADYAVKTGQFADLTEYVKDMPNYNKYFEQKYWPRFMNDGKLYVIPNVMVNPTVAPYNDDPYHAGDPGWAMWVREDILAKAGYTFTLLAEINKKTQETGKKATLEDLKITPAIDTPEAFYTFLKKVKELNLNVDGRPIIPLSITSWQQFHIGSMFDFGHWRIDEQNDVEGWLGAPGAKPYYQFLNKLYNEELIDKDFVIQKDEQLQEKVASGRVAMGMNVPDLAAAMDSMKKANPDATIRYIPWPKETPGKGFYDIYQGGGWRYLIRKDFSDIKRLTQYFDWFYSDEGLDLITWGPESAGLWEMKDGKKVFKDTAVEKDMLNGVHGNKGADFYGLYDPTEVRNVFWSKAVMATPFLANYNPKSFMRSYPPNLDILLIDRALSAANGYDYEGIASAGDSGENSNATSGFFWSTFQGGDVAQLLTPKTTEEFDAAWDAIYKAFLVDGKYEAAKADMQKWFATNAVK